jgi:hypothetical protein
MRLWRNSTLSLRFIVVGAVYFFGPWYALPSISHGNNQALSEFRRKLPRNSDFIVPRPLPTLMPSERAGARRDRHADQHVKPGALLARGAYMTERDLYSIQEARERLGGISRNSIYLMLRAGKLTSVVLGCRRFISAAAIQNLIAASTTAASPAQNSARSRKLGQASLPLPLPTDLRVRRRGSSN